MLLSYTTSSDKSILSTEVCKKSATATENKYEQITNKKYSKVYKYS